MDSLTQIALGAAVGEAALGHRVGRRAALWGAVLGTLPDLDVLLPLADPVANFTYHRSWSHSLITTAVAAPIIAWLIRRLHRDQPAGLAGWTALVYLVLATHILLDASTVYGTQWLWPIPAPPAGLASMFIIDPLYTLTLLLGLLSAWIFTRQPGRRHRGNLAALALSTAYLGWAALAQAHVASLGRDALAARGIEPTRVLTQAGPLNTVLWRLVAMDGQRYHVGWYSLLDDTREITFRTYPSGEPLLDSLDSHWPVARLRWFTHGFYKASRDGDDVLISDLRMGVEGSYIFSFRVGRIDASGTVVAADAVQRGNRPATDQFGAVWRRTLGDRHDWPY